MAKPALFKVQTYLSNDAAIDIEISDFITRTSRGRRATLIRHLLYLAWGAIGSMPRSEFEARFPSLDHESFRKKYQTSKPRSGENVAPVIMPDAQASRHEPQTTKPAKKRFEIKPPTAR